MTCVNVETTRSATACLAQETFDLVISDIARADNAIEGVESLPAIRLVAPNIPVLFYVGLRTLLAHPTAAQGLADEPNELLHLVLDQLERSRL
jgi:DNA-binding NtrC family response regulator